MDQKLFEEKLSEVCEWDRVPAERITKARYIPQSERDEEEGETPTVIKIKQIHKSPCPKFKDKQGCFWITNWWQYKGKINAIKMKRCKTCEHVYTPKGHWISYKGHKNMLRLVIEYDNNH